VQPWRPRSVRKIARKKNRRFLRNTEVNRFGEYIKNFYRLKGVFHKKTESGRCPRWATPTRPRQGGWRGQGVLLPSVAFLAVSYFPNFCKISKLTKNIFTEF
jgi:hypothetical protein